MQRHHLLDKIRQQARQLSVLAIGTLRQTLNSRTAVWMLAVMIFLSTMFPLSLRGDGAEGGLLRLVMTYPPALIFCALLISTVWMAATAMAGDMNNGQMIAMSTSPVSPALLWLGKWLGLIIVNAGFITFAAALFSMTALTVAGRNPEMNPAPYIHGHRVFGMDDTRLQHQATEQLAHFQADGTPDAESSYVQILQKIKTVHYRIEPGQEQSWVIPLKQTGTKHSPDDPHPPAYLQFQFRCNPLTRRPVNGLWTLQTDTWILEIPLEDAAEGRHLIPLPTRHGLSDSVRVSFSNHTHSSILFFDTEAPVALRVQASRFSNQLVKTFFMLFLFLAAAAALALAMGTLFSLPVALFVSVSLLLSMAMAMTFVLVPETSHHHGESTLAGPLIHAGEYLLGTVHRSTDSTLKKLPLGALSDARHISSRDILHTIWRLFLLIPTLLCTVCAVFLRSKEYP